MLNGPDVIAPEGATVVEGVGESADCAAERAGAAISRLQATTLRASSLIRIFFIAKAIK